MIRALQNNPFTMSTTSYAGSVATDPVPDLGTLGVTRADGTVLVAPGTGASEGGVGIITYTLTGAQVATLDVLTATWAMGTKSWSTQTEIVGGFLVNLFELKTLYPDEDDNELARRRTEIELRLEAACGRAFVPRYAQERTTIDRRGRLKLKWGSVRRILSVATDLTTLTGTQISNLYVDYTAGHIWGIPPGIRSRDVNISYEHGLDYPDETARSATIAAAQEVYGPNRVDNRVRTKSVDNVSVTYASGAGSSESHQEFASSDVVNFIKNNQRPLVG